MEPVHHRRLGAARAGGTLRVTFALPGRKPRVFTPTVTSFSPVHTLVWLGRVGPPRILDAEHTLTVEPDNGSSVFVHSESFRGMLVPALGRLLTETRSAFEAMDAALARRAVELSS